MSGVAPSREYLNENVTPVLLEGMKMLARDRPENPLQVLGQFLLNASQNRQQQKQPEPTFPESQPQLQSQNMDQISQTTDSNPQLRSMIDASQHISQTSAPDASNGP
ncbi:dpy-30 domain-containing protein Sdc1 [Schizosaccharomyces cryophilus OY26]|uniref:Dpy-30 domain-containing protein Sdc1 n=1 Tax=Schizosaccharomyces cryophilus (strain OY26 / ATCC MYA-4695 / CBS 11777 / NBRC 106824 / NRRL Y48691) TaxID=653667 RepID=S9VWA1_SCHCR|nr:dpy-30 domain-containing protein Sdc1 [Schizosaccharomyces cryophilus OY26]EPY50519.1 dpy-30 domain-containing protein Sdc1 [Schizosaccharomyces cryophilus OY26]